MDFYLLQSQKKCVVDRMCVMAVGSLLGGQQLCCCWLQAGDSGLVKWLVNCLQHWGLKPDTTFYATLIKLMRVTDSGAEAGEVRSH
jgi:hypothetical protein